MAALLGSLTAGGAALAQPTPAGTAIVNRAEATYLDDGILRTVASNEVVATVREVCAPDLSPNGTVDAPGQRATMTAGAPALFRYRLVNSGNAPARYDLAALLDEASTLAPAATRLVHDRDDDGAIGADEPEVAALELEPGAAAALLLEVVPPADRDAAGSVLLDLVALCVGAPGEDRGNVAEAVVPLGGFSAPEKRADPPSGSGLAPGAEILYTVRFRANGRDLDEVVVEDLLDARLGEVRDATEGRIVDAETGANATASVRIDTVGGRERIRWTLRRVPAAMTAELSFRARVVRYEAGATVENVATVRARGGDGASTNRTLHPLLEPQLLLEKRVEPERVRVGERLTYRLSVINPSAEVALPDVRVRDDLPPELRYVEGSARLETGDETGGSSPLPPVVSGRTLAWSLGALPAGERREIVFEATVGPSALQRREIVNRAVARATFEGTPIADADGAATAVVDPGSFDPGAVLLGTVFVDLDDDGVFDPGRDRPAPGVRLWLPSGRSQVSDALGRYTFQALEPGVSALRVDAATLPAGELRPTPEEDAPGLWRLRLRGGQLHRRDVPLLAPGATVRVDARLELTMGPLRLVKTARPDGAGGLEVRLELASDAPLPGLALADPLPEGARASAPALDGEPVPDGVARVADGALEVPLGDLAPGRIRVLVYRLEGAAGEAPLTPPSPRWELTP